MSQRLRFREFLGACQGVPSPRDHAPVFDRLRDDEVAKYEEVAALTSGAVLEAVVETGEGVEKPREGALVIFHFVVRRGDDPEDVVFSTRPEHGHTSGSPFAAVLMKSPRLPRAWELALTGKAFAPGQRLRGASEAEMRKGERRVLKVRPEIGFGHKDCEFHLPEKHREAEGLELAMDLQLLKWHGAEAAMSVPSAASHPVLKRTLVDGEGYENLRPPYRAEVQLTLRKLAADGVLQTGEVLFSTGDEPWLLRMGDNAVPAEIQSCLSSMVQSEHAVCVFRPEGDAVGRSSIVPSFPEEQLQLEAEIRVVRLIQVRDVHGDGSVVKHRMIDGRGTFPSGCPLQDCSVTVHYKARRWQPTTVSEAERSSEWSYDSRTAQSGAAVVVDLGCGELPFGLETCIHLMLPGEVSRVECKADAAYANANTRCRVPDGLSRDDDIEFEVELVEFRKGLQWAGITTVELLKEAQNTKALANRLYMEGATQLAANKYKTVVQQLSAVRDFETEEQVLEADGLSATCFSNLASCCIQDEEYVAAVDWCNKALKIDEGNAKVLLRRAKARSLHGDFELAEEDLRRVEKLDSGLREEVQSTLSKNRQRRKAAAVKQKEQFRNFFDRS